MILTIDPNFQGDIQIGAPPWRYCFISNRVSRYDGEVGHGHSNFCPLEPEVAWIFLLAKRGYIQ